MVDFTLIALLDAALRPIPTHLDGAHRGEPDPTEAQATLDPADDLLAQADAVTTHAALAA